MNEGALSLYERENIHLNNDENPVKASLFCREEAERMRFI